MKGRADRWGDTEMFVRAVNANGFSAAARALGTTPSAVSKAVSRLERRLGVRLLQRSTRSLSLTHGGRIFHERAVRLLSEMEEAEAAVAGTKGLRGSLRVSAPVELGQAFVEKAVRKFIARYPEMRVELGLTDRFVDLVEERVDVALRVGPLPSSSLIARRIATTRFVVCGSPGYLRRHGTPREPSELGDHACLHFLSGGRPLPWRFEISGEIGEITTEGPLTCDNGGVLRRSAIDGLGLIRTLEVLVAEELERGRLREVLKSYSTQEVPVHAVYTATRNLAPAVHAFVDTLSRAGP